jgi:hypothetical protein
LEIGFQKWIKVRNIQWFRWNYWCMKYFNVIISCLDYLFMRNPKISISENFGVVSGFFGFQFLDSLELQAYITTYSTWKQWEVGFICHSDV